MWFLFSCYLRAVWFARYENSVLLLVLRHFLSTLLYLLCLSVLPVCLLWVVWLLWELSSTSSRNRLFDLCVRPACFCSCRLLLLKSLLLVCPMTLCVLPHPLSIFLWCSWFSIFTLLNSCLIFFDLIYSAMRGGACFRFTFSISNADIFHFWHFFYSCKEPEYALFRFTSIKG